MGGSWTLGFTLDSFNLEDWILLETGAALQVGSAQRFVSAWGEPPLAWVHPAAWAVIVPLLALVAAFRVRIARQCCARDFRRGAACLQDASLAATMFLQLPAGIALVRAFVCEANPDYDGQLRWSSDSSWACATDWRHLALMVCAAPALTLVLLGAPAWLCAVARRQATFDATHAHERFLRWREAEYRHALSYAWRRESVWVVSSFVRPAWHVFDRALLATTGSVFVIIYGWLRIAPLAQILVVLVITLGWACRQSWSPGYRSRTSNALQSALLWTLVWTCLWSALRAARVVSELTVDTLYSLIMGWSHFAAGVLCLVILISAAIPQHCCRRCGCNWPDAWPRATLVEPDGDEDDERVNSIASTRLLPRGLAITPAWDPESVTPASAVEAAIAAATATATAAAAAASPAASSPAVHDSDSANRDAEDGGDDPRTRELDALLVEARQRATDGNRRRRRLGDAAADAGGDAFALGAELSPIAEGIDEDAEAAAPALNMHSWDAMRELADGTTSPALSSYQAPAPSAAGVAMAAEDIPAAVALVSLERRWILLCRLAREALTRARYAPAGFVDVAELRALALAARNELRVASRLRHVFALSLRNAVEECAAVASAASASSMLPHTPLEEALRGAAPRLAQREAELALVDPCRRRMLLKLLAVRAFIGPRILRRLPRAPLATVRAIATDTPTAPRATVDDGDDTLWSPGASAFSRGRSLASYANDPEADRVSVTRLQSDDILAMAPRALLYASIALTRAGLNDRLRAPRLGSRRPEQLAADRRVRRDQLAACKTRWAQHIRHFEGDPAFTPEQRRSRVAWYDALGRVADELDSIPEP